MVEPDVEAGAPVSCPSLSKHGLCQELGPVTRPQPLRGARLCLESPGAAGSVMQDGMVVPGERTQAGFPRDELALPMQGTAGQWP